MDKISIDDSQLKSKPQFSLFFIEQWILVLSAECFHLPTLPLTRASDFTQAMVKRNTLLKDCGFGDSNNWTETLGSPLIQLPYVSISCLSWNTAPFSESPTSCLSFPDLGSMTSDSLSRELAAILLLMSVCLSTSQGGFCYIVRRKTLIHIAYVSILWWQWLVELQKMFKILAMIRLFKVAKE